MIARHALVLPAAAVVVAACGEPTAVPPGTQLPRSDTVEARALWVSRFEYSNAASIVQILSDADRANFNVVYLQVRGVADALYVSDLEPCSIRLCGTLGGTPTWDPLALAVAESRTRGIQIHAWINAFIGWTATTTATCAALVESSPGEPRHVLLDHPDWTIVDATGAPQSCPHAEGNVWLSPGIPGVRTHLARIAADIARRYADVAGIHLDFIRYPGPAWSYDAPSLAAFDDDPAANPPAWAQFRRDQVSAAVRETHDSVMAVRPSAVLSAAVWGIYDDKWGWSSSEGRDQYFQDPRAWMNEGSLDIAVPMIYWRVRDDYCGYTDWLCLLDDHMAGFASSGRQMYAGTYAPLGADEVIRAIRVGRERGTEGFAVFSYGSAKSTGLFDQLEDGEFRLPARVPTMSWKP